MSEKGPQNKNKRQGFTFKLIPIAPVGPDGMKGSVMSLRDADGRGVPFQTYRNAEGTLVIDAIPEQGGKPYPPKEPKGDN